MGIGCHIPLASFGVVAYIVKYNTNKALWIISNELLIETMFVYITCNFELKTKHYMFSICSSENEMTS